MKSSGYAIFSKANAIFGSLVGSSTYRQGQAFFLTKSFSSRELLYPLLDQVMATKKKWLSHAEH